MKTNTLKAVAAFGLTALLAGSAAAQSFSQPVGYETLNYTAGFNYLGLRLVEAPAATGALAADAANATVSVTDGVADALTDGTSYIFEVISGETAGAVTTVESFDAAADTITLTDNLAGDFLATEEFIIRPADTLASVFGAANDVANDGEGLESVGNFSSSDQVWVPDGSGSFDKYAFVAADPFAGTAAGWQDEAGGTVVAEDIDLIYTDGIILLGIDGGDVVISGSVKLEAVQVALTTDFNYLSSVYPAGLTLAESELSNTLVSAGNFSSSDQVWVPNGDSFDKYAFVAADPFAGTPAGWQNEGGDAIVPEDITFDDSSGIIVVTQGDGTAMVTIDSPDFYDTL